MFKLQLVFPVRKRKEKRKLSQMFFPLTDLLNVLKSLTKFSFTLLSEYGTPRKSRIFFTSPNALVFKSSNLKEVFRITMDPPNLSTMDYLLHIHSTQNNLQKRTTSLQRMKNLVLRFVHYSEVYCSYIV